MKIGAKLYSGFSVVIVLTVILILLSLSNLNQINNSINKISYDRFPKTVWSNNIIDALNGASQVIRDVIIINDTLTYKEELKKLDGYANTVVAMLDSLNSTVTSDKGKEILNKLSEARENYVEARKKVLDAINKNNFSEASKLLFSELEKPQADYIKYANEMISFQLNQVNEATIEADDIYKTSMLLLIIIAGISVIISILIALIITRGITKPIKLSVEAANKLAVGDTKINLETKSKDETAILINAMNNMANSISSLVNDANKLGEAAIAGKLDVRADASKYSGDYKNLINGINGTLDAIICPLNVAAEYVDRISKGDIPPRITDEYKGDFNEIKNNLNCCMDAINLLIQDSKYLANAAINGKLDTRANANKHQGDFRTIIQGVNNTLDNVIGPLNVAAEYVDRISKGDIPPKITDEYKGDFNEIKNNINSCIDNLNLLGNEIRVLSIAALEGKLDVRADITKHQGVYRKIVNGFNDTLDSVIGPLNVAAEYVDRISKGDIPPRITDEYKGDFNEIKNNLNQCIDVMNGLLNQTATLIQATKDGKLDQRGDSSRFTGGWGDLVSGVNQLVDAFVAPINVTAEYVDRISKGDIPPRITDEYKGDFNEIKNNINHLIDNISVILTGVNRVGESIKNGNLQDKGNADLFQGDWKNIVTGINGIIESFLAPLNITAEYIDRISKGDIPPRITEEYKGDFNEIKSNLNGCIDSLNGLISEMNYMSNQHDLGDIDVVINTGKFTGAYQKMAQGVNDMVNGHITVKKKAMACFTEFGNGNLSAKIEQFPGKKAFINDTIEKVRANIIALIDDAAILAKATVEGKLDTRADAIKHQGDFRKIIEGVNDTLDAVIGPLNVAAEYVDRISKGDIPPKITEEYKGDFNEIKNNLNSCIDGLQGLVEAKNILANIVINDYTKNVTGNYLGIFAEVAESVNSILIKLRGITTLCIEVSNGDLTQIDDLRKEGKRCEFDNLNPSLLKMMEAIQELVNETVFLANAGAEGKLAVRGDTSKFKGEYVHVVEGFNKTMDNIINPLNEAGEVLSIYASGDLTPKMVGDYKGDLAVYKENINTLGESLSNVIREVLDAVQSTASAAIEISSTADTMAVSAEEQSKQADEVASAVEEMSRTITENAMNAGKTADVAEKNGNIANEGGLVVERTVDKMRDIAKVVKQSADNMEKLGESSKQIGEIISVIDDIADQTNLLALNAAIEAARAGEQGRGFAVVADEVRKLAERTTEATKQIAVMIKGIQNETQLAVAAMNKGNNEVAEGISLADKAGASLKSVVDSSRLVQDMINQIAAASEEQSSTSEQIAKNVGTISHVTNDSARRIQDIAHSSDDLSKLTEQLRTLVSQFKVDSSNIGFNDGMSDSYRQLASSSKKHLPAKQ